jgi:hypothetical protein
MGIGNMGIGNMGNGGGPGGSGTFFADRVDLPFVTAEHPAGSPIARHRAMDIEAYPLRNWSPEWYSWVVLSQFVKTKWDGFELRPRWARKGWDSTDAQDHANTELDGLVAAARDERANALGEILSQTDEFNSYFLNLMSASSGYPATAKFLVIVNFIAGFCAMHYKGKYQRPRPTMLCPALLPPIAIPAHASFPSGHSTAAHLMAFCLTDLFHDRPHRQLMQNDFLALADRIARNREIAGVHYPSDTQAGIDLAGHAFKLLPHIAPLQKNEKPGPEQSWYTLALDAARTEWV